MDFAQQQRNPGKHMVGIAVVILLHVFIVYALVTGLATKVVEVIKKPIETKIIEEVKPPPPPPPEIKLPPPPKFAPPPPVYVPPPEVQVQAPPPVNAPAVTTAVMPTAPAPAVAPRVAQETAPAPARPASIQGSCQNIPDMVSFASRQYQRELSKDDDLAKQQEVLVQFSIGPGGEPQNVSVVGSANRTLSRIAVNAVKLLRCTNQVTYQYPFVFRAE